MGWLRLVGSLKLEVSFVKEPYKRDLYSAKETYNLKEPTNRSHPISYIVLRLVGSLKLQVSFAQQPYKRDLYSPKRPIISGAY